MVKCSKHEKFNPSCTDCRSLEKAVKGSGFGRNEYITNETTNNDNET